jgi:hypothetical protein
MNQPCMLITPVLRRRSLSQDAAMPAGQRRAGGREGEPPLCAGRRLTHFAGATMRRCASGKASLTAAHVSMMCANHPQIYFRRPDTAGPGSLEAHKQQLAAVR